MYICICNAVTDRDIKRAATRGVSTIEQLRFETGCAGTCGQCESMARQILDQELASSTTMRFPMAAVPA